MPDGERFVPLEQVIASHLGRLFPGMEIGSHHTFRVTRNADLTLEEEEADDLLAAVEMELRRRRFGRAVRLEIDHEMSTEVRELLQRELDVSDEDVYPTVGPLDLSGLWAVHALDRPDLKDPVWVPIADQRLASRDEEEISFFNVFGGATCSCTTRTRRSPRRSRSSSGRRRSIRRCWPSSSRSTAPRVTARSSSR